MSNEQKLNAVFSNTFEVDESEVQNLAYDNTPLWDSVGQMSLITNLEDAFDILIDSDDIMDINSYESALSILNNKYKIGF